MRRLLPLVLAASLPAQTGTELPAPDAPDRRWLGPELWANRLQDWRLRGGRIECVGDGEPLRTAHVLTRRLTGEGAFTLTVDLGSLGDRPTRPAAAAGVLIGVGGGEMDPRAAALVHHWPGNGGGLFVGLDGRGRLIVRDNEQDWPGALAATTGDGGQGIEPVRLEIRSRPEGIEARALDPASGAVRASLGYPVARGRLTGNVALVSHPGPGDRPGDGRFWFDGLTLDGAGVGHDPDAAFGPVACTQYTLSRGILKLTAQLLPLAPGDHHAELQVRREGTWNTIARAPVVVPGWTATFRVPDWDDGRDIPFRVVAAGGHRSGTVRRDPVDRQRLVLAAFTGNHNNSHAIGGGWGLGDGEGRTAPNDWVAGMWFPHREIVDHVRTHDPDLLFFSGDQVYQGKSPTRADHRHLELDYLYKWYLWCLAYRDLTREIPCVTIPDDHDVYQGNLWGHGGRKAPGRDHTGGYVHPARFVRMVERTQTSHLPDPVDPRPVDQGIGVWFTELVWGRVGFAVLEDRKFKSGCVDAVPAGHTSNRPDHVVDPDWDPAVAEEPDAVLLGPRQLAFLGSWVGDWRGQELKVALSQTVFGCLSTHHGAGLRRYVADLDSNGWPPRGRDRALDVLRRGYALHVAGDQHLATVVHHGIERHGDALWSFCVPSIANFYPRAWAPTIGGRFEPVPPGEYCGDFLDGFGHEVTVHAATNPDHRTGRTPTDLYDRMPGYGIVIVDKPARRYELHCWPRHVDPAAENAEEYRGWPVVVDQRDNHAEPVGWLVEATVAGTPDPVVQVFGSDGELEHAFRAKGDVVRVPAFAPGPHRVRIGCPDRRRWAGLTDLEPRDEPPPRTVRPR